MLHCGAVITLKSALKDYSSAPLVASRTSYKAFVDAPSEVTGRHS